MNTTTRTLGLVCALGLYACGGNGGSGDSIDAANPGAGTVVGTIEGAQYSVAAASAANRTDGDHVYTQIILSSQADSCAQYEENVDHPSQQVIVIDLGNGTSPPTATGVYTVTNASSPTGQYAIVAANATDANCQLINVPPPGAMSGTVTLTNVADGAYSGTFDVMFDEGDHVTGSFGAVACPAIDTASSDPPCQ